MPDYEFRCAGCGADFHVEMPMSERAGARPVCPACGGADVEQVYRSVHINTRKASCGHDGACACGEHCCHEC